MNRTLLEKPFEPAQIRQRKGRNGVLDYVEGHNVIHRLNESLEGAWSFEITHHEIREDEVLVLGRLSAEGITKMQFGVSQVTRRSRQGADHGELRALARHAPQICGTTQWPMQEERMRTDGGPSRFAVVVGSDRA